MIRVVNTCLFIGVQETRSLVFLPMWDNFIIFSILWFEEQEFKRHEIDY